MQQSPGSLLLLTCIFLSCCCCCRAQLEPPGVTLSEQLLQRYLTNGELAAWLQEFAGKCSNISAVTSMGKSTEGHDLWVLELSDAPGKAEPEPGFWYVANMHGDEPSGRMLLPQLAEWLCAHNGKDPRATRLLRHTHIYITPTLNPDGFAKGQRANAANVDLNRNFPDPIELGFSPQQLLAPPPDAQPETLAVMAWLSNKTRITAAANLHEGAVCANYPFDGFTDHSMHVNGTRNPAPDDATFVHLAKTYARAHTFMAQSKEFPDGITNGAQWYPVYRGMQDWSYLAAGALDITLELSDAKWRPEGDLPALWAENRDALLALPLAALLGGVQGRVTSARGGGPLPATIAVSGVARNSSAEPRFGYYNRPLAPGQYQLTAVHAGYAPRTLPVAVPADGAGAVLDFKLQPAGGAAATPPDAAAATPPAAAAAAPAAAPTPTLPRPLRPEQQASAQQQQQQQQQQEDAARRPGLLHAVRPHHMFALVLLGVLVCAAGGAAVWTVLNGRLAPGEGTSWLPGGGGGGAGGGSGGLPFASRPAYVALVERKAGGAGGGLDRGGDARL